MLMRQYTNNEIEMQKGKKCSNIADSKSVVCFLFNEMKLNTMLIRKGQLAHCLIVKSTVQNNSILKREPTKCIAVEFWLEMIQNQDQD